MLVSLKVEEWGDRIPIGVFYQNETVPTYEERILEGTRSILSNQAKQQITRF